MFFITTHMIRNQYYQCILPSRKFAIFSHKMTYHAVCIGKSIQTLVLQPAIWYVKRLMTAGCLEDAQHRMLYMLFLFQISQQLFSHNMIVYSPFAQLIFNREISIRYYLLISLRNKIRTLVSKINITTIIISILIILSLS